MAGYFFIEDTVKNIRINKLNIKYEISLRQDEVESRKAITNFFNLMKIYFYLQGKRIGGTTF